MSDIAIKFENISKQYRLGTIGTGTLSHDLKRWWIVNIRRKEDPYLKIGQENILSAPDRTPHTAHQNNIIWALRDINLEVRKGEVLGIIGKNGAGKSTLLKILSRVTTPTTGIIKARGRIASLLEVGTGFHPEMTGRENIFMNGSIMGMKKAEITRKLEEIVDFAGVETYIDTPVKRYSSGMTVRLGFAIAAHLEPEILVVDEVLAVGDAEFQKKAIGKMQDVSQNSGRTVLFVSHNMAAIQSLCALSILLEKGKIHKIGASSDIVKNYLSGGIINNAKPLIEEYRIYKINASPAYITDIYVKNFKNEIPTIAMNESPTIVISILVKRKIKNGNITISFYNTEGVKTDMAFSWDDDFHLNFDEGIHEIEFSQKQFTFSPGRYTVGVGINQSVNTAAWDGVVHYPIFEIVNLNYIVYWNNRPWALHHSQNNSWKSIKRR